MRSSAGSQWHPNIDEGMNEMISKFRHTLLLGSAALVLAAMPVAGHAQSAAPQVNGWDVAQTDIEADTSIRYGTLSNGMKYAIWPNSTPEGAASMRLHFNFGSIGEGDSERGFAHLIEHMAFNGTTNVKEGEMVKMLERLGLAFGADSNAVTGFDMTYYILELPVADEERIDTSMFLLREAASEVLFEQSAVDAERGVIEGERRSRDSFGLRQYVDQIEFVAPETPYPDRLPIGLSQDIQNAASAKLRDLYHRYYRPENATFIVTGDIDPDEIEAKIKERFGDWRGVGAAGAPLPRGTVDLSRSADFDTFIDPAVPTTVRLSVLRPYVDEPFTKAEWREDILRNLARSIVNRRIRKIANQADSVILGGAAISNDYRDAAEVNSLVVVSKDGEWRRALDLVEQEARRAVLHGVTEAELATELAELETRARNAAEQADTRRNNQLAEALIGTIGEKRYLISPQYEFEQLTAFKPTLTVAAVNEALREMFVGSAPLVHVSDKTPIEGGEEALAAAFAASTQVAVAPPAAEAVGTFAYESFGNPGRIVFDERIEDLGLRTLRFDNNVRLTIKQTDFERGKVRYSVRVDGGALRMAEDQPGLNTMISSISALAGLEAHSLEELNDITAGRSVNAGLSAGFDAFVAQGTVPPADLDLQMKITAAYLTHPGFRSEAATQWANIVPLYDAQLTAQPQTVASVQAPSVIAGDDARFGIPGSAILGQRTFDEYRAAFSELTDDEPIEIAIVGDISEDAAIAAVANSFGALPERLAEEPDYTARPAAFRSDRTPVTLTHTGPADQALAMSSWATTDDGDYTEVVGLAMLEAVLDLLMTDELRERLGATYGASVSQNSSSHFDDFGYLTVSATVAPDTIDAVQDAIGNVVASLRETPVDEDTLMRARNPILERIDRSRRENGYWIALADQAQSEPRDLERTRIQRQTYEAVTAADITALANKYLTPDRRLQIRVVAEELAD